MGRTRNDGSRPGHRTVVRIAPDVDPRVASGLDPSLFSSSLVLPSAGADPPLFERWVVETRRLELLTLSLQRRCSAN